jgi:NAD(P)-dependent dehydrogenase (short-subunit alcohol dehydrogenase family)
MSALPKHVLLVGPRSGIGKRLTPELRAKGAVVSTTGRAASEDPLAWHAKVTLPGADWKAVFRGAEAAHGPLDAVVFVPGMAVLGRTVEIPENEARSVFDVNFWAVAEAALAAARHWEGRTARATFLAVLSISGRRAVPFEAYYGASKAAAARFLDALQLEYLDTPVRFVPVFPGLLDTPFRDRTRVYGLPENAHPPAGTDVRKTARAIMQVLTATPRSPIFGWKENAIDLVDRVTPRLYDELVLRRRVRSRKGAGSGS